MLFGSGVGDVLSCGRVAFFIERFLRWGWLVATSGGLLADWPERGSVAGLFSLSADIHLTEYIMNGALFTISTPFDRCRHAAGGEYWSRKRELCRMPNDSPKCGQLPPKLEAAAVRPVDRGHIRLSACCNSLPQ